MINVLSQFDGISCGQLALQRAGVCVENYYASEIDKYAIQIAKKNFPRTNHLGDVTQWRTWNLPRINLLIAGSPCQGFSLAGKGLNFDDPRSRLFFEFVETLKFLRDKNPDLMFLLENVKMKKDWQAIISEQLGVQPIKINSALVSAQNRERLYWTNIQGIIQPEDKEIYLKDILEDGVVDREKSYAIDANYFKGGNARSYFEHGKRQLVFVGGLEEGRRLDDGKSFSRNYREGYRIYSSVGKSVSLTSSPKGGPGGYTGLYQVGLADDIRGLDVVRRVYSSSGKSWTLSTMQGGHRQPKVAVDEIHYRKLTPLECERLQTLPDNYTEGVSSTQRYKCIGNGWTVDVVAHIFSFLPERFFV